MTCIRQPDDPDLDELLAELIRLELLLELDRYEFELFCEWALGAGANPLQVYPLLAPMAKTVLTEVALEHGIALRDDDPALRRDR